MLKDAGASTFQRQASLIILGSGLIIALVIIFGMAALSHLASFEKAWVDHSQRAIGDINAFKSGRELAAWLRLVPRQHSTGGKPTLLGISKQGDTYLRTLLIHGGRTVVRVADKYQDQRSQWTAQLNARRGKNISAVAVANKNARVAWALLNNKTTYQTRAA